MTRLRTALLILLVLSIGVFAYSRYKDAHPQHKEMSFSAPVPLPQQKESATSFQEAKDLALARNLPKTYPRPASEWIEKEKNFFARKLASEKYDVLVLPFQVDGYSFSSGTRITMSALLVDAISQTSKLKIPDPFIVSRALGDGQRLLDATDVQHLAETTGVTRIVYGYVSHNLQGGLSIRIEIKDKGSVAGWNFQTNADVKTKRLSGLTFTETDSPIDVFEKQIPQILTALDYDVSATSNARSSEALDTVKLPATPQALFAMSGNPARVSYTYLLLAALTPQHLESTKNRFAAKAFVAIRSLAETAPEYRALRARAYLGLGYRSAAIALLKEPHSDEEKAILAVLDGNLPQIENLAAKESSPLKRLLLSLDQNRIEVDYGVSKSTKTRSNVTASVAFSSVWTYLTGRKLSDRDAWAQFDNLTLKGLLDKELPIAGFSLETLVSSAQVRDDLDSALTRATLSANEHFQRYWDLDPSGTCCGYRGIAVSDMDYLDLLSSIGHDNAIRRMTFLTQIQSRSSDAIDLANSIEPVYKGHSYFTLATANAKRALGEETAGPQGQGLMLSASGETLNAAYWEQGQSLVSSNALVELAQSSQLKYGYFRNLYAQDIPYHPRYLPSVGLTDRDAVIENGLAAISNATSEFEAVTSFLSSQLINGDPELTQQVSALIAGRFIGCPQLNILLASGKKSVGDIDGAISLYKENIKQAPGFSQSYLDLGILLHESAQPSEAAKIFLSYPAFKSGSNNNRIQIANHAYEMGSYFYQSGDLGFAASLYKIAAAQRVGAQADLTAALRLQLLNGNLEEAAAGMINAAQRYGDASRFRDYFGVLHATGNSKEAWQGFENVVAAIDAPQIWESALVGHHRSRDSEQSVVTWAKQPQFKNAGNQVSFAAAHVARFATTDRIPTDGLATILAEMDRPTWKLENSGRIVRRNRDGLREAVLGPRVDESVTGFLENGAFDAAKKQAVKSALAYFVESYRSLKLADFAKAKTSFDEAASLYDMTSESSGYMLPYYAIAAGKTGDATAVESILARVRIPNQQFEFHLAKAAIAALKGNHSQAMRSLKVARYRRPNANDRPVVTQYTYADVCETLFLLTNEKQFKDEALDWARVRQRTEPWFAWSYAVQASLATDPTERRRAIAYTHYLDPNSERLSHFTKRQIDAAVKEFGEPAIFRKRSRSISGVTANRDTSDNGGAQRKGFDDV